MQSEASAVDQCVQFAVPESDVQSGSSEEDSEEAVEDQCMPHAVHQCLPLAVQKPRLVHAKGVRNVSRTDQCLPTLARDNTKEPSGPPGVCPLTRGLVGVGASGAQAGVRSPDVAVAPHQCLQQEAGG